MSAFHHSGRRGRACTKVARGTISKTEAFSGAPVALFSSTSSKFSPVDRIQVPPLRREVGSRPAIHEGGDEEGIPCRSLPRCSIATRLRGAGTASSAEQTTCQVFERLFRQSAAGKRQLSPLDWADMARRAGIFRQRHHRLEPAQCPARNVAAWERDGRRRKRTCTVRSMSKATSRRHSSSPIASWSKRRDGR